jgi:beta-carotene 3-hydroxylase
MLTFAVLFVATVAAMEGVAFLMHKYVMHGPMWFLHESHHVRDKSRFELNDLFGVFFAIPSIILIYLGTHGQPLLLPIGLGMTAYGAIYFGFHDVIVHRRIPHTMRFTNRYLQRIIKAHHIHHATRTKDGAVSFGFVYAPPIEKLKATARRR